MPVIPVTTYDGYSDIFLCALQGDSRLANQLLHACQLYRLPQVAVGVCRQMGVHHWQAGRTAAAISWFIRGDSLHASPSILAVP